MGTHQQQQQWRRPSHTAAVASGVASGDCHGSGAQCGGSDRVGVVVVLRAPMKWSPPAAAGCVEPSLRPRVRVQLLYSCTLVRNQGQPHFFILRAGSLSPPTRSPKQNSAGRARSAHPPRSPKQNSAGCWLLATGRGALIERSPTNRHCLSNRIPLSAGWRLQAIFRVGNLHKNS